MNTLRNSWQGRAVLATVVTAVLALPGCNRGLTVADEGQNRATTAELFTVPPNQMAHIQVLTAQPSSLSRSLRLTGSVAYNSFHTTPVIPQVGGPVSRIVVAPGEEVQKGQPMLYVSSPDYSQLRTNYLKAKDAHALAQTAYARAQDLYQHHALAQQELEQAASAEVQARGDMSAAEAALRVLGITDPDAVIAGPPSFEAAVSAPAEGQVVEQDVAAGQLLQAGTTQCFVISNTSTVWVLVNVYQQDLPYVRVGDPVAIQTDAYPNVFHGRISYVASFLDPNTRTLQARIVTNNPRDMLKKDMYVTATVAAGTINNTFSVPDSAVLRDTENQPFVYVESSPGKFGRRSVNVGQSSQGQTQITSGLAAGDRFIGNGSLFLQFANSLQ